MTIPKEDFYPTQVKEDTSGSRRDAPVKRPYRVPRFEVIGDVREITLSPSPGKFESGPGPGFQR